MGEERLPRKLMFEQLVEGKGYSGGQDYNWMVRLEERHYGSWHEVPRVAKSCTESRQMVSTGRGRVRGIHAEMA